MEDAEKLNERWGVNEQNLMELIEEVARANASREDFSRSARERGDVGVDEGTFRDVLRVSSYVSAKIGRPYHDMTHAGMMIFTCKDGCHVLVTLDWTEGDPLQVRVSDCLPDDLGNSILGHCMRHDIDAYITSES